jgi:colanic acid biosynthesis glycosyl transferase WcaI
MGKAQALSTVLNAAALLQQRGSRVCWVMLGGGVEVARLKAEAEQRQLANVVFLPAVPMAEVGTYLHAADALLVHLRKDPLFEITIPSKTQAYMAVGKPLLMAVDGDAADLVRQSGGGVVAESENAEALAQAAEQLASSAPHALAAMGQKRTTLLPPAFGTGCGCWAFWRFVQAVGHACSLVINICFIVPLSL